MYNGKDAETVHHYLERTDPGKYRILIFTPESKTETVYNSGNNARYDVCLYNHDGHYDVIKSPQKFFGARHYCVECEKTYANIADHKECSIRCPQCFRSGQGFPCEGEYGKELEGLDCRKLFRNQDCMDHHKPYSCNTFHRCTSCNCHYTVVANMKNGGHDCNEKFCRICFQKHRKDVGCYISPLKEKKVDPHRIVAYDVESIIRKQRKTNAEEGSIRDEAVVEGHMSEGMESTEQPSDATDEKTELSDVDEMEEEEDEEQISSRRRRNPFVDMEADEDSEGEESEIGRPEEEQDEEEEQYGRSDNPNRTDHECISAIVTCSNCIDKGTWNDLDNTDCEVCGPQKVFKLGEWEVDEGKDLVDEFLDFLLHELPSDYKTYAYAHNGGRYDGYFMMRKLYGRSKLRPVMTSTGHKMFQIRNQLMPQLRLAHPVLAQKIVVDIIKFFHITGRVVVDAHELLDQLAVFPSVCAIRFKQDGARFSFVNVNDEFLKRCRGMAIRSLPPLEEADEPEVTLDGLLGIALSAPSGRAVDANVSIGIARAPSPLVSIG